MLKNPPPEGCITWVDALFHSWVDVSNPRVNLALGSMMWICGYLGLIRCTFGFLSSCGTGCVSNLVLIGISIYSFWSTKKCYFYEICFCYFSCSYWDAVITLNAFIGQFSMIIISLKGGKIDSKWETSKASSYNTVV